MKIGVDVSCWQLHRGFGRFTRELFKALVPSDKRNQYVFFTDAHSVDGADFPGEAQLILARTSVATTRGAAADGHRSLRDLRILSRLVRQCDLDLFFFPAVYSYFPIFNRTRIIVTIHDLIADQNRRLVFPRFHNYALWRLKERLAVAQADAVLTVSDYSRGLIQRRFNVPDARIRAVWEAAGPAFGPAGAGEQPPGSLHRVGLDTPGRYVLYVGGISPHKNLPFLLKAFERLVSEPALGDVRLVLAGDYGGDTFFSDLPAVKACVSEGRLSDRVVFTGRVTDAELAWLYRKTAAFVLPSLDEGFGLPAVEAMACGAPVLVSRCGSLPEVVGEAGLFFDPLDVGELTGALRSVLTDRALSDTLRQRSLSRAGLFDWTRTAGIVREFFERVAQSGRGL